MCTFILGFLSAIPVLAIALVIVFYEPIEKCECIECMGECYDD